MRRLTYAAACFFITCGVWAVPISLGLAARIAAAAEPPSSVKPLAYSCDGRARVNALALQVDKPGTYTVSWDNSRLCGTAT